MKRATSVFLLSFFPAVALSLSDDHARTSEHRIVRSEIARFAREFTNIEFVWLTGETVTADLHRLSEALGEEQELMDYEHLAHHVETLNSLNLRRIKMMLANDIPSSSLYRVGADTAHGKPYVVILTMTPNLLTDHPHAATCYMYDTDCEHFSDIDRSSRVENSSYLRYVVRHEIAHALKAYLFAGHAFTNQPMGGDYNSYLSEIWADMFAMMMEMRFGSSDEQFIRNLQDARTINLAVNLDVQHYTSPQTEIGLDTDLSDVTDLRDLAQQVDIEYRENKPSYHDYLKLVATAHHVRDALAGTHFEHMAQDGIIGELGVAVPQEDAVARLKGKVEAAMHRVFR